MQCQFCGAENKNRAKFCARCGQRLGVAEQPAYPPVQGEGQDDYRQPETYRVQPQQKNPNRKLIAILIPLVIVTVALITALVYYIVTGHFPFMDDQTGAQPGASTQLMTEPTVPDGTVMGTGDDASEKPTTEKPTEKSGDEKLKNATSFKSAKATSTLGDMGKHNYKASNVLNKDGACWCEGASGYGVGESITLELPERQLVSGIYLLNGYAGTEKQYDDNAKINDVEISFSDGQSFTATLQTLPTNKRKSLQKITFSQPVATSSVTLTIKSVTKAACEDTCLTYVEPF